MSHPRISFDVYREALEIPQGNSVQAEYIWIGGNGMLRCKTRTMPNVIKSLSDLPIWNFDGSSTEQAEGKDSEVFLRPVKYVPDPFRRGNNVLVLCECLTPNFKPVPTNTRAAALEVFENPKVKAEKPWFGIEQEFTLFEGDGKTPLGWPQNGFPAPQGPYYCGIGTDRAFGRRAVEAHYRACLFAGLNISGINAEVMPGQWEYQVGPCEGIDGADQHTISRFILTRVCEEFGINVSFSPKPINGDWNGAGCHTNFSTQSMRNDGGYDKILEAVDRLSKKHIDHIFVYGADNHLRLTGRHETAPITKFSYGVANRGASIRIPRQAEKEKKGYFEDRRPASNMDPYLVTAKLCQTIFDLSRQEVTSPHLWLPANPRLSVSGTAGAAYPSPLLAAASPSPPDIQVPSNSDASAPAASSNAAGSRKNTAQNSSAPAASSSTSSNWKLYAAIGAAVAAVGVGAFAYTRAQKK